MPRSPASGRASNAACRRGWRSSSPTSRPEVFVRVGQRKTARLIQGPLAGVLQHVEAAARAVGCVNNRAVVHEYIADAAAALTLWRLRQESGDLLGAIRV